MGSRLLKSHRKGGGGTSTTLGYKKGGSEIELFFTSRIQVIVAYTKYWICTGILQQVILSLFFVSSL